MTSMPVGTLVVGAGVIGTAIAAELHRAGDDVHLVDAGIPGEGVSSSSFAWVNSSPDKTPEAYRRLNLSGLEAHHRVHSEGRAPWFHPSGALSLAVGPDRSEPGRQPGHTSAVAEASTGSYDDLDGRAPRELMGRDELSRRHPHLSGQIRGATHFRRDGWIDVPRMIHALLANLPADRVRTCAPVRSVSPRSRAQDAAATLADGTTLTAERVVVAAGHGASSLLEEAAPGLELLDSASEQTQVGMTIETFPLDTVPTTVVLSDGVSMRPTEDGGVMIADHATAAAHEISDPEIWKVPEILVERARSLVPGIGTIRPRTVRISPRVWPRDGLTVSGWIADGVYTVLTHSGVTLAQHLAECVRQEIAGGTVTQLDEFRPDRFVHM